MPADTLKPWREVALPRKEVADGSFDESVFAADLGLVDVVRGAVLPLAKANPLVEVDIVIRVDGGSDGVGPDDLDLTIIKAMRQLGLVPDIRQE